MIDELDGLTERQSSLIRRVRKFLYYHSFMLVLALIFWWLTLGNIVAHSVNICWVVMSAMLVGIYIGVLGCSDGANRLVYKLLKK